jgi:hypothetical protein
MSNIPKRDRKELTTETKVVLESKQLVSLITKATLTNQANEQPKIPKRRMEAIGNRLLNNAIDAYEELRYQDRMYPDTKKSRDTRVAALYRGEKHLSNLVSDIDVLPYIIPSVNHSENWYNEMLTKAIDTYNHCMRLRQTIEAEYNKINSDIRKKNIAKSDNTKKSDNTN